MKILKWVTISEYVDGETGEVITKEQKEKEYITIKKIKNTSTYEQYNKEQKRYETIGVVTITNECRKTGKQLGLF